MLGLEFTPSTIVIGLVVLALAALAVHRLWRNGMCDCHADSPRGCSSGCAGCSGCSAAEKMVADARRAASATRQ